MIHQIKQDELPQQLQRLINAALRGDVVFIEREDKARVQLLPVRPGARPRKAGSAKGLLKIADDFDAPLDDFTDYMP